MEGGSKPTEKDNHIDGDFGTALELGPSALPSTDFVKVEKNLASLGFFTPSSKRTRDEKVKTVSVTVVIEGKRIDAKATIAPTALFGLPITADQDKWLALHKILSDLQVRDGKVTNPVSFSSAELLALLKVYKDSGKNYKDVGDWLDVMVGTTIISEGAVYFAGKRTFGKDTFHVFDRAVSFGKELPDGSIADKNYVWLSQWQLQNINNHHQLPIDLDTYRQLKNYIAKALVPLLQVWLYATRQDGVFEKRYDELCQILNVRQWTYLSKIKEKLGPSLNELKEFGYLADWQIEKTSDKQNYKILFYHGDKFHRDRTTRLNRKRLLNEGGERVERMTHSRNMVARKQEQQPAASRQEFSTREQPPHQPASNPELIAEFTRRGITEPKALELLSNLKSGQDVVAQLEHIEQTIKQLENSPHRVIHPDRFYIRLIERNTPVPDGFETSAKRKAREEKVRKERERRAAEDARDELEWDYERYCAAEVDRYIQANLEEFQSLKDAKAVEERKMRPSSWPELIETAAKIFAKNTIQQKLPLLTFEEFVDRKKHHADFSLKPVGISPLATPSLVVPQNEMEIVVPASERLDETELAISEPPQHVAIDTEPKSTPATGTAGEVGPEHAATLEPAIREQRSDPVQECTEQVPSTLRSDPVILLASEYPPEPGRNPIDPTLP